MVVISSIIINPQTQISADYVKEMKKTGNTQHISAVFTNVNLCTPEMEPVLGVTRSTILVGSGHGSVSDPVVDPVLSFNMRVYRGVVSTE